MVAVPSGDTWKADTAMAMIQMMLVTTVQSSVTVSINNFHSSILPVARDELVKRAMGWGATHILFIDSDMIFPPEVVIRLLSHEKEVVAANCVTKRLPAHTTARLKSEDKIGGEEVFYQTWNEGDLHTQEVWRVGTGVMLIDMKVFEKLPRPWFPINWDEELGVYRGEDWGFCEKCEKAGIPLNIDIPLSFMIKHTGKFDYDMMAVDLPEE